MRLGRKVLMGLSGIAALIGVGLWVSDDISAEGKAMASRILETRGMVIPLSQIYPEKWDHVCWLGDYSKPSSWIPRLLPQSPPRLKFVPYDVWVDEGQRALVFVDSSASKATVFLFDYRDIDPPDEPNCVERNRAMFRVETIAARDLTYTKLMIPSD